MSNQVAKPDQRRLVFDLIQNPQQLEQFSKVLPGILTPERFARTAITSLTKTPRLLMCTKESLMRCLMEAAQFGLEVDGRRAHLIPFGEECTLIIDWKGLVELMKRSGEVMDVHLDVVYEEDQFDFSYGNAKFLHHKPSLVADRGKVIACYSFIKLRNDFSFEVMAPHEVIKIRDRSRGWQAFMSKKVSSSPWNDYPDEMFKKTVLRRHSKSLTLSPDVMAAIERDDDDVAIAPREKVTVNTAPAPEAPGDDWLPPKEEETPPRPADINVESETAPQPNIDEVKIESDYDVQILAELKKVGLAEKDLFAWMKGAQQAEAKPGAAKTLADLPEKQQQWLLANSAIIIPMAQKLKQNMSKVA